MNFISQEAYSRGGNDTKHQVWQHLCNPGPGKKESNIHWAANRIQLMNTGPSERPCLKRARAPEGTQSWPLTYTHAHTHAHTHTVCATSPHPTKLLWKDCANILKSLMNACMYLDTDQPSADRAKPRLYDFMMKEHNHLLKSWQRMETQTIATQPVTVCRKCRGLRNTLNFLDSVQLHCP